MFVQGFQAAAPVTVPAQRCGGGGAWTSFISLRVLVRQPISGDKRQTLRIPCDVLKNLATCISLLRSLVGSVLCYDSSVCDRGDRETCGEKPYSVRSFRPIPDQVTKGEDPGKLPGACSIPTFAWKRRLFLLRELPPPCWPPAVRALHPLRAALWGPVFPRPCPHQNGSPGLRAVSAECTQRLARDLALGQLPVSVHPVREQSHCELRASAPCCRAETGASHVRLPLTARSLPSSCMKSGRATGSSTSTSPSTWSGESVRAWPSGRGCGRPHPSRVSVGPVSP